MIRTVNARTELLGHDGPQVIGLLGVPWGMFFAAATRASCPGRAKWFLYLDWNRASRLLRAFRPAAPPVRASDEKSPKGLESAVREEVLDKRYGLAPPPPGDKSHVRGVNSSACTSVRRQGVWCGLQAVGIPYTPDREKRKVRRVRRVSGDGHLWYVVDGARSTEGRNGVW